jgi:pimeloyl-ACP methyl ester carboxylesterase
VELPDDAVTVRVPTTLLWGERDKALLPSLLDGLERWVPQLDLRRVPSASHWIVHEQPGLVADCVAELLA